MSDIINKLVEAQQYAISIRPQSCGFPVLAEVLRKSGVLINRWMLPSCQSIYFMTGGAIVQQGTPLVTGFCEIPKFNRNALILAIRKDQDGQSNFSEFLQSAWESGVISYEVDFIARKIIYYGINDESYLEEYSAVNI